MPSAPRIKCGSGDRQVSLIQNFAVRRCKFSQRKFIRGRGPLLGGKLEDNFGILVWLNGNFLRRRAEPLVPDF